MLVFLHTETDINTVVNANMTTGSVTRRNDPCPCGSGKKFKKCCMNKVETMDQGLVRLLRQEFDRMNQSLYDYTQRNFKVALDRFYTSLSGRHSLSYSLQDVLKEYVTIWGIFNLEVRNNRTPFDFYVESYLDHTERQASRDMVTSWENCHFSTYAIESISSTGMMALEDVWTKEKTVVPVPKGNKNPNVSSLLVGLRVSITEDAQEFMLGYAEVESHVWSPAKLERIRGTYLSDPNKPIGEQFDQNLPYLFIELISETTGDGEAEGENEASVAQGPREVQPDLEAVETDVHGSKPANSGAIDTTVTAIESDEFPGNDSQKHVLSLYLDQVDQSALDAKTIEQVRTVWVDYVASVEPTIKKPEAFAAALDYFTHSIDANGQATQASISKKYGVSAGTISKNYRLLVDFTESAHSLGQKHA